MGKYDGLKIYVFYGQKGNGKSLFQAKLALQLISSYFKIEKKYPHLPHRTYWSNQKFSDEIEQKAGAHLRYWTNPRQLIGVRDADIGWDEIGKDFPAGGWEGTPKKIKQIFSHLRKRGNRLFANTQVYEDIDISFRRQVDKAYRVVKVFGSRDITATLPPPKMVYGLITVREFDPMFLENERDERKRIPSGGLPSFALIKKRWVEAYDTRNELPPYMPDKLEEQVLICEEGENCRDKERDGRPHTKVLHRAI